MEMLREVEECKKIAAKRFNKPLAMTDADEANFAKATTCHICDKEYTKTDTRLRDHCHIIDDYRGSGHQDCNLKLRINAKELQISVIFHNLRGYDSQFSMREIGAIAKKYTFFNKRGEEQQMDINAVSNNKEKYVAFILVKHIVFLDSFRFMSSGQKNLLITFW